MLIFHRSGCYGGTFEGMRCPRCSCTEDRVVDSRSASDGSAIRRRRECGGCGARFTTYERLEEVPLVVVKRSGEREQFDRAKVAAGVAAASKNRPVGAEDIAQLSAAVEESLRFVGGEVTYEQVGLAVLEQLRRLDEVAYLRFASVYKGFSGAGDFKREAGMLERASAER